jgi:alkylhydroperoxidase family enzyme
VAVLNNASFEWDHHAPILVEAGFPSDSLHVLKLDTFEKNGSPDLQVDQLLSPSQLAALAYADQMTLSVKVSDDVFERLKQHYDTREIVEITATISAYNCVSRFLVALDVDERAGEENLGN